MQSIQKDLEEMEKLALDAEQRRTSKIQAEQQNSADDPQVSERFVMEMLKLLKTEFDLDPKVIFSPRLQGLHNACYKRPVLLMLPSERSGQLTESRVLHEVAHVLELESRRPFRRPHSSEFRDQLRRVERAWKGQDRPQDRSELPGQEEGELVGA